MESKLGPVSFSLHEFACMKHWAAIKLPSTDLSACQTKQRQPGTLVAALPSCLMCP